MFVLCFFTTGSIYTLTAKQTLLFKNTFLGWAQATVTKSTVLQCSWKNVSAIQELYSETRGFILNQYVDERLYVIWSVCLLDFFLLFISSFLYFWSIHFEMNPVNFGGCCGTNGKCSWCSACLFDDPLTDSLTRSLTCSLVTRSLTHWFTCSLTHSVSHWHTDSLTFSLSRRLTHWLTDTLTESLTCWLTQRLPHWLTHSLARWHAHWITDSLTHWLADALTDSLTHCLVDSLTDLLSLTHWLNDSLTDSLSLTHWLAHWFARSCTLNCDASHQVGIRESRRWLAHTAGCRSEGMCGYWCRENGFAALPWKAAVCANVTT